MAFSDFLAVGQIGEGEIARWLRRKGWMVLPVYEKEIDTGKGPRLFIPDGELIAPDLLTFRPGKTLWVEAKSKTGFAWYRKGQTWTTGIDLRHYEHYQEVAQQTPWDVWLLFLQRGGPTKDCPYKESPSGLYGNNLKHLVANEDHRSDRWGRWGMVYWSIKDLQLLCPLHEVCGTASYELA